MKTALLISFAVVLAVTFAEETEKTREKRSLRGYEDDGYRRDRGYYRERGYSSDRDRYDNDRGYGKERGYVQERGYRSDRDNYEQDNGYGKERGYGHEREYKTDRGHYDDEKSYGKERGYVKERGYSSDKGYGKQKEYKVVEKHYYKKPNQCYQCAYSPPKKYTEEKVFVEEGRYGKSYKKNSHGKKEEGYGKSYNDGYGNHGAQYGREEKSYGSKRHGHKEGGYRKETVVAFPFLVYGGWDKCIGPFSKYEAKKSGIDEWDCDSNCYTRRDPNGDIFRGCYKGEYGVNPDKLGCHKQAGSVYCFCKGDKCNNGPSPHPLK